MHLRRAAAILMAVSASTACGKANRGGSGGPAHNYELVCDSSDTRETSTLFCMRMDTRTGDVKRVDLSRLPQSNGPTKAAEEPAGVYQLVCDSTDTELKSDFRCIRLNRRTGELLLVSLPKVETFPEGGTP